VEAIGIARAAERARSADLVLLMTDLSDPAPLVPDPDWAQVLHIGSKLDLLPAGAGEPSGVDCAVSARSGAGIAALLDRLSALAARATRSRGEVMPSRLRHVELLRSSLGHLLAATKQALTDLELRAEELRLAGDALGRITGAIDVEDLLDAIFSRFCIGK
jgi:tRNA modification GTPase